MDEESDGPVVIVTGAGGTIGAAIAVAFRDAGWRVVAHHRTSEPPPGMAVTQTGDLTERGGPARLIEAALVRFGRLDAVVNNAASQTVVPWDQTTDHTWQRMLEVNLGIARRLTTAATGPLAVRGGSIVHIASVEATTPAPDHAAYAVSKAALVMHAKAAALELGPQGIRVNAVSPGLVERPGLVEDWLEGVARWRAAAPLGRLVTPAEVADACVFLTSSAASAITGIDLTVDAGVSVTPHW